MHNTEARVVYLQKNLIEKGMNDSLRALNLMIGIMNSHNGYMRKDGSHYYYHLVDATQDLLNHGITDETVITACILHDAVEDIPTMTIEDIEQLFGIEVAFVVDKVTKAKGVDYKDEHYSNIKAYLNNILQDWRACLVKSADRKHNFSTLDSTSSEHEERQMRETSAVYIPFFKEARKKYPEYSAYFHSTKTTIVPHLKRINKAINDEKRLNEIIKNLEEELSLEKRKNNEYEKTINKIKETLKSLLKG